MSHLIEEPLEELLEALRTDEALLVIQLSITVHHLLRRGEAGLTALTDGIGQSIGHVAVKTDKHASDDSFTIMKNMDRN